MDKSTNKIDTNVSEVEEVKTETKKDTRTPVALEKSEELISIMGKEKFDELFRITGINALSVFMSKYPDSPITDCYKALGNTNQKHFRINGEDWVIRMNGARVKK